MIQGHDGLSPSFWVSTFDAGCAAVAAAAAVYVAWREAQWRRSDRLKQLEEDVREARRRADNWHETEHAKQMKADSARHDRTLAEHKAALANVATREDIARVEGLISTAAASTNEAKAGIDRIESILLKNALTPHPHS